jgi:hypothetical protein
MKKIFLFSLVILATQFGFAQKVVMMQGNLKLTMQTESFDYPEAAIGLLSPEEFSFDKPDTVKFKFSVESFSLGNLTADYLSHRCANSAKGQHIHFILDNKPYEALYKPQTKVYLSQGNHLMLAFLSRSYQESIKTKTAYVLKQIKVGDTKLPDYDLTKPLLFFSRPKGIYIGADTAKVLLDFYLVNTVLSAKGNKVRATINGKAFMLTDWKPYLIEGLPMGESTIKLELVDKKGKVIDGPYNVTERKITLATSEPLKSH